MDIMFSPEERKMMTEMQSGIKDGKLKLDEYSCSSPSIFDAVKNLDEYDFDPEFVYDQYKQDIDPTNAKQDNQIGSFRQGAAKNCWFLSGLKASQDKDPSFLNGVINPKAKDEYSVKFPGEEEAVSVSEKELKSATEFSTGDKDVRILEIAADKVYQKKGKDFKHDSGSAEDFQALFYPGKKVTKIDPKISLEEDIQHKQNLEFIEKNDKDIKEHEAMLQKDPENIELVKLLSKYKEKRALWAKVEDVYNSSTSIKEPAKFIKSAIADPNKVVTLSFKKEVKGLAITPQHSYSIDKEEFLVNPHDTIKKTKIHVNSLLSNPVVVFGIIDKVSNDVP